MTAFDRAWDVLKALLPDLPFESAMVIGPSLGMRADPGDMDFTTKVRVKDAIPMVEQNIDRRADETLPWKRMSTNRKARGVRDILNELAHPRIGDEDMGLFQFPHNIENRRIARNMGYPTQWDPWEKVLAPEVLNRLLAMEQQDKAQEWISTGWGMATPHGQVRNMSLIPGFSGQGMGQHILGSMVQNTGSAGDSLVSSDARNLMDTMGRKMTAGGTGNRFVVNHGFGTPEYRDYVVQRVNPAGDMFYNRPIEGTKGGLWRTPQKWQLEGNFYNSPSMHPYQYERLYDRKNVHPRIKNQYPLEVRYTGDDPTAMTNIPTYIQESMVKPGGFFYRGEAVKDIQQRATDSYISNLIDRGLFEPGWRK